MPPLGSAIARIFRDAGGASATIVAIALPILIGFGALGVETGVWFAIKLQNQSAADAAAISAAYQVIAGKGDVVAELTLAASEAAARNGYKGSTPAVIYPYNDTITSNGIAVTLQQTLRAVLASLFLANVSVATKAVAIIDVLNSACILALGTSGTGLEVQAGTRLDMPNCAAAANSVGASAIDLPSATGSITAATLVTAGEVSLQGSPIDPTAPPPEFVLASPAMIGAPRVTDPYASALTGAFLASSMPPTSVSRGVWNEPAPTALSSAFYQRGMSFGSKAIITLNPGVYYVNGNFAVSPGAKVTGNGVAIVLTKDAATGTVGNVQISPSATVTLTAPNSGPFSGRLFVQDPSAAPSGGSTFEAGGNMRLTGLLYFPNTTVGFQGNPDVSCTVLIANQVIIAGNSNLTTAGCRSAGLSKLPTIATVVLAE